ncbi:unnamed protein product [Protopolystoma xenopodis]|uniref:Uncharacterized protein n=1 Tax=Protopolystoma xenopodis TaxID=117903 RepID=A0A448WIM9_9PLAT|nr:unnamed protein product [Protopolystoma xenopodis]
MAALGLSALKRSITSIDYSLQYLMRWTTEVGDCDGSNGGGGGGSGVVVIDDVSTYHRESGRRYILAAKES